MSSPKHPTSNIEGAFSSNFLDYTTASPGNVSPDPPNNLSMYLFASLAILPFHNVHHEKQMTNISYYLEELSFHRIEKMEERLVNGWIIIPRDFVEVKTKLKEARTQIRGCIQTGGKIAEINADEEITLVDMETQVDIDVGLQGRTDDDNAATKDTNAVEPTVFNVK
nr:hypothetical protein [Tanacetum cinerariifolium]